MFQASVIRYPVKLKVTEVARNVHNVVEARAKKMLEALCSYAGFTKPGSLRLLQMGPGVLSGIDMGRHYTFQCAFAAEVCNPAPGARFKAYVRSLNRFGALVEAGYIDPLGSLVPVIELVVIRDPTIAKNEVDIDDLALGDEVGVEVLGRRYELRDTRITGFARTVLDVDADSAAAAAAAAEAPGATLADSSGIGSAPGSGAANAAPGAAVAPAAAPGAALAAPGAALAAPGAALAAPGALPGPSLQASAAASPGAEHSAASAASAAALKAAREEDDYPAGGEPGDEGSEVDPSHDGDADTSDDEGGANKRDDDLGSFAGDEEALVDEELDGSEADDAGADSEGMDDDGGNRNVI